VVWKEPPESTTQSVGEGEGGEATRCVERARGGAPTMPLGGEGRGTAKARLPGR
jgi:hypothetical protein